MKAGRNCRQINNRRYEILLLHIENQLFSFDENLDVPYERDEILRLYWGLHPRFRFLKSCSDGNFLDIGSGSGGLIFWKEWELPIREQLNMYAVDQLAGEFTDRYEAFEKLDLNDADFPYKDAFFNSIFSAHVLEHLKNPSNLIRNLANII